MKGFVLAAGFGQRMAPLTESVPKPLLTVGNWPLIAYAIAFLRQHGIVDIMVNTHHLAETLEQALGDGQKYGVRLRYSREPEILGTGGALKKAHAWLDEPFVVVNSDVIIEHDLSAAIALHHKRNATATMVLRKTSAAQSALAVVETDARARVLRLHQQGELPSDAQMPIERYMFTGVHVVSPKLLDYIPNDVHSCVIRYGYTKALANQEPIYASMCTGFWQDAGLPQDYLNVNVQAVREGLPLGYLDAMAGYALAPKRDLGPAIRLGDKVDLGANVALHRPVALGNGCEVGDKASVGPDVIAGANARIGREASIGRCVLLPNAEVGNKERLRDTIVGPKARLSLVPSITPPA